MLRKSVSLLLLSALFLLSSCGESSAGTAIVTYIVTVTKGEIGNLTYLDPNGNEVQDVGDPGQRTYTRSFPAKEGTFLFISAVATDGTEGTILAARILSNGSLAVEANKEAEDGVIPVVSVETFATIPEYVPEAEN